MHCSAVLPAINLSEKISQEKQIANLRQAGRAQFLARPLALIHLTIGHKGRSLN